MSDAPDPVLWDQACEAMRSRSGMGSMRVMWNPYECRWEVVIDYADRTEYRGEDHRLDEAIRKALAAHPNA